jgi:hypothetical protein
MVLDGEKVLPVSESATGKETIPSADWRRLYTAAVQVRELEPWRWMEESDLFGVWPAGRDSAAFISSLWNARLTSACAGCMA